MKAKEYVKKYGLDQNDNFSHTEFVQDLQSDFEKLVDSSKAKKSLANFHHAVQEIRDKWDGINNKTYGQLPEGLWGYFFATVIVPCRDGFFPDYKPQRKKAKDLI